MESLNELDIVVIDKNEFLSLGVVNRLPKQKQTELTSGEKRI